jgi:predicted ATPase
MDKKQYEYWTKFRENTSSRISKKEYTKICEMHAIIFSHPFYEPCACNPKGIQRFITDLNKIYDNR